MKIASVLLQILTCLFLAALLATENAVGQEIYTRSQKCKGRTKQEQLLLNAVNRNDLQSVKALLEKGASANTTDSCGHSVLMYAAFLHQAETVKLFLTAGADVRHKDNSQETALIWALEIGEHDDKADDNFAIVKSLISAGADVNAREHFTEATALILATKSSRLEAIELLAMAGADVNAKDNDDKTALSYAIEKGDKERKALLKKLGANVREEVEKYKTNYGDNAFIQATMDSRADVVEAMLENGLDVNRPNAAGVTALMRVRNIGILKTLLEAGANVHSRDNAGFTALIHLSANLPGGDFEPDVVKSLLKAGADIEAKASDGKTALMFAALQGDVPTVRALLEAGAKLNERDNNSKTALSYAVVRKNQAVAKLLKQAGALP